MEERFLSTKATTSQKGRGPQTPKSWISPSDFLLDPSHKTASSTKQLNATNPQIATERVRVYEKIRTGIWSYNGVFSNRRKVRVGNSQSECLPYEIVILNRSFLKPRGSPVVMPRLEFWFEFASTYSYPAAMRIEKLAHAAGVAVHWNVFLLGPIFREQGWKDSPFNIFPAKGKYMWRDLQRTCAHSLFLSCTHQSFPAAACWLHGWLLPVCFRTLDSRVRQGGLSRKLRGRSGNC